MEKNIQAGDVSAYLKGDFMPSSEDKAIFESALTDFGRDLAAIQEPGERKAAYQAVNLALCRKRDALREKFNIDKDAPASDQIEALAAHEEGGVLLNAFIMVNERLASHIVQEFVNRDPLFAQRSYDRDDLKHTALYGEIKKGRPGDDKTKMKGFVSQGLLAGAMKYDSHYAGTNDVPFSAYIGASMRETLKGYTLRQRDKRTVLKADVTDFHRSDAKRLKNHDRQEEQVTAAVSYEQTRKIIEEVLGTITPQQADVLRKHTMGEMTLKETGKPYGLKKARIGQIEEEALKRLQHPSRSERLRPLHDKPDISR